MKFKKLMFGYLLHFVFMGFAGEHEGLFDLPSVAMPDAATISARLSDLDYFVEKSKIDIKLGGKKLNPFGVVLAVGRCCKDYHNYLEKHGVAEDELEGAKQDMLRCRQLIYEALLKEHPEGLKALERHGMYKPAAEPAKKQIIWV